VGKGALRAVPTNAFASSLGGHASLCPPYEAEVETGVFE
jgi:hypothetical protein